MGVGKTIGKQLNNGFPGGYAIQPDQLSRTYVNGSDELAFGDIVLIDDKDTNVCKAVTAGTAFTEDKVLGVAMRIVKQADSYVDQNNAKYLKNEAVSIMQRGTISVICVEGSPVNNGKVYYRHTAEANKPVGFSATASADKTVEITNMRYMGSADANGIVAVAILTKKNA